MSDPARLAAIAAATGAEASANEAAVAGSVVATHVDTKLKLDRNWSAWFSAAVIVDCSVAR